VIVLAGVHGCGVILGNSKLVNHTASLLMASTSALVAAYNEAAQQKTPERRGLAC
jgi:hypothetical protein